MNRAIVFAHYDRDDIVDDYVYSYLQELKKISSTIIFVSTAKLSDKDIEKLKNYSKKVIVRENSGYDFFSYKVGLHSTELMGYDEVIICNDSVYGPFYDLQNLFDSMKTKECDFWGVTDSFAISYHLQSYFLVFKKDLLQSKIFKSFWNDLKIEHDKEQIILKYELGLSKIFMQNGFKPASFVNVRLNIFEKLLVVLKKLTIRNIYKKLFVTKVKKIRNLNAYNLTHNFWKTIILKYKMPFIKIELLRDNPKHIDIKDYKKVIQSLSKYDLKLIENHLLRMNRV